MSEIILVVIIGLAIYFFLKSPEHKADEHSENNQTDFGKMNDDVILNGLSWRKTCDNMSKGKYDVKK